jgi:hypothetical protein
MSCLLYLSHGPGRCGTGPNTFIPCHNLDKQRFASPRLSNHQHIDTIFGTCKLSRKFRAAADIWGGVDSV